MGAIITAGLWLPAFIFAGWKVSMQVKMSRWRSSAEWAEMWSPAATLPLLKTDIKWFKFVEKRRIR